MPSLIPCCSHISKRDISSTSLNFLISSYTALILPILLHAMSGLELPIRPHDHPTSRSRTLLPKPIIGEALPDAEYEYHEAVENTYWQLGKRHGVAKVDTSGLAGSKTTAKMAVGGGVWLRSRANMMRKVNRNRSAKRERAQGGATTHSALLCQPVGIHYA
jgi:hypothetical protein